jgi:hypothetical protein
MTAVRGGVSHVGGDACPAEIGMTASKPDTKTAERTVVVNFLNTLKEYSLI